MTIKFGEIDAAQILDNEYRSKLALALIQWLIDNHSGNTKFSEAQFKEFQKKIVEDLQKKYPNSGVKLID